MPGCAKKLAVRSSFLSIMNTSFCGLGLFSILDVGFPVFGSKSISFSSPPLIPLPGSGFCLSAGLIR